MDGTEPYTGYDYDPALGDPTQFSGDSYVSDPHHAPHTVEKDTPPEPSIYVHDSLRTAELDLDGESFSLPEKYTARYSAYGEIPLIPLMHDSRRTAIHPLVIVEAPPGYDEKRWKSLDSEGIFTAKYDVSTAVEEALPYVQTVEEETLPVPASAGGGGSGEPTDVAGDEEEERDPTEMPFLDHLEEFRWALLKSIFVVSFAMVGSWFLTDIFFVTFSGLAKKADIMLMTTKPLEVLIMKVQMSLVMGVALTMPLVFYFIWSFVAPGLYKREKKWILPLVFASTGLFFIGVSLAYFFIIPMALIFLKNFNFEGVEIRYTIGSFIGLIIKFIILFGVLFQMPLVSFILAKIGIIKYQWMTQYRKYAIVVFFVIGAILTPPEPISQIMMAVPLIILYEVSILVARIAGRKTLI